MIQKWFKNDQKMFQKWFKNDLKMFQKCFNNDSKMIQKWFKNDPKMIHQWSKNVSKIILKWFKNDPVLVLVIILVLVWGSHGVCEYLSICPICPILFPRKCGGSGISGRSAPATSSSLPACCSLPVVACLLACLLAWSPPNIVLVLVLLLVLQSEGPVEIGAATLIKKGSQNKRFYHVWSMSRFSHIGF